MKYKKPMLWVSVIAIIAVICVAVGLMSNPKANLQTEDFNKMIVGAELPYLLYGNNDYCIMNMWHGGVIVYDFTTHKISDRITFDKLKETGFSYPVPMVSEDGQIIYFREDSQTSKQPYTYSYNLQTKKLDKETDDIKDVIHYESIYENQLTQAILLDGLAYGVTMIVLDDVFIVSRLTAGGSLLSDTEIVFLKKDLTPEKIFYLGSNRPANEKNIPAVPETFLFGDEKFLTMAELNTIAQKGETITWDDFAPYTGQEVGSGLYIMRYPMKQSFYVTVGGTPGEEPMYIRLCYTETEEYIDIQQQSIDNFVENMTGNNGDATRLRGEIVSVEALESDDEQQPPMYKIVVISDGNEIVWRTFVSTTASLPIDSLKPGDVITAMCSPELITVSPQRWNVHHIQF